MGTIHATLRLIVLGLLPGVCYAAKDADLKPTLAQPGPVLLQDNFDSGPLAKPWNAHKGDWQFKDGALTGVTQKADNHPAALMIDVPQHDSVIRFSFKLIEGKPLNLIYDAKEGHLFRVVVNGTGVVVSKDAPKNDPKAKPAVLAKADGKLSEDWHTMLVEVKGSAALVQVDDVLKASVTDPGLDVDKIGFRIMTPASTTIDDFKLWQVGAAAPAAESAPLAAPEPKAEVPAKKQKANKTSGEEADVHIAPIGTPIVYKNVEGRDLKLFVTKPADWKATDKRPAIVFFHGGGWEINKGGPSQFNAQSEYLATRGLVCIQVQYRLIANNRKEAPLICCQDAKSSMRWVRTHAPELGIDTDRIASSGGSAGGHLAAFVGMVEGTDDPHDDLKVSCRPAAMLLYNPALLHPKTAGAESKSEKPEVSQSLADVYGTISPYLNVSKDDPPGIILVGSEDGVIPQPVLKAFQEKCKAVGVRMDAVTYPGEGHSFFGIGRSLERFYDTTIEVDKFLGSLGWVQGAPTLTKEQVQALSAKGPPVRPNKTKREAAKKDAAKKETEK